MAPSASGVLRVPKSVSYAQAHGQNAHNMVTIDAHTYNALLIECKEMRTALHQLQRTIAEVRIYLLLLFGRMYANRR